MALAHFRMLINELLNKDPGKVPEEAPLIVLDSKYAMCMASSKDCPDTGKSTGAYINLYQGGPIDHVTDVPGPVAQ